MNQKQKLGYTALGAVIMLVGIGIGSIVSPPLIAQGDGVFDAIKCTKLIVADKAGKTAIRLDASEDGNSVIVYDRAGKAAIQLSSLKETNGVIVYDKPEKVGVVLITAEKGNDAVVFDKAGGIKWGTLDD